MATINCFDKSIPENQDQTIEHVTSNIVNVERDDLPSDNLPQGNVTIYFEEKDGKTWYICISNEELQMIKSTN